ncbi:MAG TPA: zeta toxin family protein [Mucilaginibacter sp.]|nr:zeta toxin family protein [Mucilaginibacter sp.]
MLNCFEFVNADSIAAGLSPLRPESVSFEAGRIMLDRINKLIDDRADFAFETTLSTRSYPSLIKSAKNKGYDIWLLFFWRPSPDMAKERVKLRVENGGHAIAEDIITRRYYRGVSNLINIYYSLADNWFVFDNTMPKSQLIAGGQNAIVNQVANAEIWNIINKLGNERQSI